MYLTGGGIAAENRVRFCRLLQCAGNALNVPNHRGSHVPASSIPPTAASPCAIPSRTLKGSPFGKCSLSRLADSLWSSPSAGSTARRA